MSLSLYDKFTNKQCETHPTRCAPSNNEWIMMNTKREVKGEGRVGYGGLITNHNGAWRERFSKYIGNYEGVVIEL